MDSNPGTQQLYVADVYVGCWDQKEGSQPYSDCQRCKYGTVPFRFLFGVGLELQSDEVV
jgi:hypothetical protein